MEKLIETEIIHSAARTLACFDQISRHIHECEFFFYLYWVQSFLLILSVIHRRTLNQAEQNPGLYYSTIQSGNWLAGWGLWLRHNTLSRRTVFRTECRTCLFATLSPLRLCGFCWLKKYGCRWPSQGVIWVVTVPWILFASFRHEEYALVEMQVATQTLWDQRSLAYAAASYGNQLLRGQEWKDLRRVIGIDMMYLCKVYVRSCEQTYVRAMRSYMHAWYNVRACPSETEYGGNVFMHACLKIVCLM